MKYLNSLFSTAIVFFIFLHIVSCDTKNQTKPNVQESNIIRTIKDSGQNETLESKEYWKQEFENIGLDEEMSNDLITYFQEQNLSKEQLKSKLIELNGSNEINEIISNYSNEDIEKRQEILNKLRQNLDLGWISKIEDINLNESTHKYVINTFIDEDINEQYIIEDLKNNTKNSKIKDIILNKVNKNILENKGKPLEVYEINNLIKQLRKCYRLEIITNIENSKLDPIVAKIFLEYCENNQLSSENIRNLLIRRYKISKLTTILSSKEFIEHNIETKSTFNDLRAGWGLEWITSIENSGLDKKVTGPLINYSINKNYNTNDIIQRLNDPSSDLHEVINNIESKNISNNSICNILKLHLINLKELNIDEVQDITKEIFIKVGVSKLSDINNIFGNNLNNYEPRLLNYLRNKFLKDLRQLKLKETKTRLIINETSVKTGLTTKEILQSLKTIIKKNGIPNKLKQHSEIINEIKKQKSESANIISEIKTVLYNNPDCELKIEELIKIYLQDDINSANSKIKKRLKNKIKLKCKKIVRLIASKVNYNQLNKNLIQEIENKNKDKVNLLLNAGASIYTINTNRNSVLNMVQNPSYGDDEIKSLILQKHKVTSPLNLNENDKDYLSQKTLDAIENGADINTTKSYNESIFLFNAIRNNDLELVKKLTNKASKLGPKYKLNYLNTPQYNIHDPNDNRYKYAPTPLMIAGSDPSVKIDIFKFLIENGAYLETKASKQNSNDPDTEIETNINQTLITFLIDHIADSDKIKLLLQRDVDVTTPDEENNTALDFAYSKLKEKLKKDEKNKLWEIIKVLEIYNAPTKIDKEKKKSLFSAKKRRNIKIKAPKDSLRYIREMQKAENTDSHSNEYRTDDEDIDDEDIDDEDIDDEDIDDEDIDDEDIDDEDIDDEDIDDEDIDDDEDMRS